MNSTKGSLLPAIGKIIIALCGLSLVVIVHELGHWFMCQLFHVATPVFSIGFGPSLGGIYLGKTFFQIALLPLGGYVEIAPDFFNAQPYIHQLIIMIAGIVCNVMFGLISCFYIAWHRSRQQPTPNIDFIIPHSPAAIAQLHAGDRIKAIDQHEITSENWTSVLNNYIPQQPCIMTIERNNELHNVSIENKSVLQNMLWLGIKWQTKPAHYINRSGAMQGARSAFRATLAFFDVFIRSQMKNNSRVMIIGPIGIMKLIVRSMALGFDFYLLMLALISFNVAIFNLLPIPFFDGGKILSYTIKACCGQATAQQLSMLYYLILFVALLLWIIYGFIRDARRIKKI